MAGLSDEITSPTKTAPSPTNATPPIVVDDNQVDDEVVEARLLRVLGLVERRFEGSERKERDEEESTNPICFRLGRSSAQAPLGNDLSCTYPRM